MCVCVCVDVCVRQGKDGRWSKKATIATSHAPITRPPVILTSVSLFIRPPTTERHSIHHLRQVNMAVAVDIKHTEESCGYNRGNHKLVKETPILALCVQHKKLHRNSNTGYNTGILATSKHWKRPDKEHLGTFAEFLWHWGAGVHLKRVEVKLPTPLQPPVGPL